MTNAYYVFSSCWKKYTKILDSYKSILSSDDAPSFASCTKNVAHHQKNITDPHLRDASNIKRILVN